MYDDLNGCSPIKSERLYTSRNIDGHYVSGDDERKNEPEGKRTDKWKKGKRTKKFASEK